jgi:hypothetical protein
MMQPARIWYQSFTDPDVDAPYFTRLRGYLRSIAGPGCDVDLFGLRPGDRFLHPITEFRCAAQVISAALRAQRETALVTINPAFVPYCEYEQLRAQFVAQIEPILELGVDVIILAGGYPMLLFAREVGFHVDGAMVLNGLPVAVAAAETAIRLTRLNRTATSRRSTYALPPGEAVAEFERLLGLPGPTL